MINLIILIISFIPAIIVCYYFKNLFGNDEYNNNYKKSLKKGIISSIVICLLALVLNIIWSISTLGNNVLLNAFFHNFILAGFVEEFVKYKTAKKIVEETNTASYIEVIIYFALVALGFNFIESIIFALATSPIEIIIRGLTMPHLAFGLFMGYFYAKSLKTNNKKDFLPGFIIPFLLHGLYDFSLSPAFIEINEYLIVVPFILIFIEFIIMIMLLRFIKNNKNNDEFYAYVD